jgi:hypothetical protein
MSKMMTLAIGAATLLALQAGPALAGTCRDPWITQAITEVTGKPPTGSGESGDCTYTQYGGGRWSNYPQLKGYVQQTLRPAGGPAAGQVAISRNQVQQWRTTGGVQQFQYNNKWYTLVSNANGGVIGTDSTTAAGSRGSTFAPR